jgi:GxxExxY protein
MELNEITYAVNGAIFEVNRVLGPGFLEKVYEKALIVELKMRGLDVESQVPVEVRYKGETVGDNYADIVVEQKVLIKLKTVEQLEKIHEAQLL